MVYIVHRKDFEGLLFKIENGLLVELPHFPGLQCKIGRWEPKLKLRNHGIMWLWVEDFFRDDGK